MRAEKTKSGSVLILAILGLVVTAYGALSDYNREFDDESDLEGLMTYSTGGATWGVDGSSNFYCDVQGGGAHVWVEMPGAGMTPELVGPWQIEADLNIVSQEGGVQNGFMLHQPPYAVGSLMIGRVFGNYKLTLTGGLTSDVPGGDDGYWMLDGPTHRAWKITYQPEGPTSGTVMVWYNDGAGWNPFVDEGDTGEVVVIHSSIDWVQSGLAFGYCDANWGGNSLTKMDYWRFDVPEPATALLFVLGIGSIFIRGGRLPNLK